MKQHLKAFALLSGVIISQVSAAWALDAPADGSISIDLAALEPNDKGCVLVFVGRNGVGADLVKFGVRLAAIDKAGKVSPFFYVGPSAFPNGKTRIFRPLLPDMACADIAQVVADDVSDCSGDTLDKAACAPKVVLSNHSEVTFGY